VTLGTWAIAVLGVLLGSLAGRIGPRAIGSRSGSSPVVVDSATAAAAAATVHDWSVIAVALGAVLGCLAVWGAVARLCARVIGGVLFGGR